MTANLQITHPDVNSGSPVRILGGTLVASGKKRLVSKANVNPGTQVDVQVQTQENILYSLTGIQLTGASGTLTFPQVLAMYRSASPATLELTYGKTGSTSLVGFDGADTTISVQMDDWVFKVDTSDSKGGYLPTLSMNFIGTA